MLTTHPERTSKEQNGRLLTEDPLQSDWEKRYENSVF